MAKRYPNGFDPHNPVPIGQTILNSPAGQLPLDEYPWVVWRSVQSSDRLHYGWRSLPALSFRTETEALRAFFAYAERGSLTRELLSYNGGEPGQHLTDVRKVDFRKPKMLAAWKADRARFLFCHFIANAFKEN